MGRRSAQLISSQVIVKPNKYTHPADNSGDELITKLQAIADDENAPAAARTSAVRTILEAQGRIGRLQRDPGSAASHVPLSTASRPQLEQELARLRLQHAATT